MNKRNLLIAFVALLVVIAAAFGLSTTRGVEDGTKKDRASETADSSAEVGKTAPVQEASRICASNATYARLKEVAFEEAFRIRNADPANLDTLAASSIVRMENPVIRNRDEGLGITVCSGRFVLELPPGAERGFGGQRQLVADVEYAAQEAADGSGLVYQLSGAEPIVNRLAAFDLSPSLMAGQPASDDGIKLAQAEAQSGIGRPEAQEVPAAAVPASPAPQRSPERRAEVRPAPASRAETREPERASPAPVQPRRTEVARAEEPERARVLPSSRPSFNCRYARTRGEVRVCESSRLAAKDRAMSSLFYSALADADPRTRRELRRTRDRFLAYRDRCADDACISGAYDGRMQEIRDIMELSR